MILRRQILLQRILDKGQSSPSASASKLDAPAGGYGLAGQSKHPRSGMEREVERGYPYGVEIRAIGVHVRKCGEASQALRYREQSKALMA